MKGMYGMVSSLSETMSSVWETVSMTCVALSGNCRSTGKRGKSPVNV